MGIHVLITFPELWLMRGCMHICRVCMWACSCLSESCGCVCLCVFVRLHVYGCVCVCALVSVCVFVCAYSRLLEMCLRAFVIVCVPVLG